VQQENSGGHAARQSRVSRETLLSYAELSENLIENILDVDASGKPPQTVRRTPQILAPQFQLLRRALQKRKQRSRRLIQLTPMAFASQWHRFASLEPRRGLLSDTRHQVTDALLRMDRDKQVGLYWIRLS